jgi:hypothetical protein
MKPGRDKACFDDVKAEANVAGGSSDTKPVEPTYTFDNRQQTSEIYMQFSQTVEQRCRTLRQTADAEDASQEVFLGVAEMEGPIKNRPGWISTVTSNVITGCW